MGFSTLTIAWRNLWRNRRRTLLAVSAIALGQMTVVFVNCLMTGMMDQIVRTVTGPLVGHAQVQHPEWREEQAPELAVEKLGEVRRAILAQPGVRAALPRVYGAVLAAPGERGADPADADPAMIVGVDVAKEAGDGGLLETVPAGDLPGSGRVVVGHVLAKRLDLSAGRQLAVVGQDSEGFPASGLFRVSAVVRGKTDLVNRMGVVMDLSDAAGLLELEDRAHQIVVHGEDYRRAGELVEGLRVLPALAGAEVLSWREALPEIVMMIEVTGVFDAIFLGVLFAAAAAGIANTMLMSAFERTREFGMLTAVGCRPARVVRMIFLEALILGLVGAIVGSLLGTALVLITAHTGIDYAALGGMSGENLDFAYRGISFSYMVYPRFSVEPLLTGFAAVALTSALAALWPAAIAARLEPVEAMRS
ncbi:MAG: ABC transporter permease [Planctomycetota bacterium]|jgi:ABC-type lipoprotein release transport system permease subunit